MDKEEFIREKFCLYHRLRKGMCWLDIVLSDGLVVEWIL